MTYKLKLIVGTLLWVIYGGLIWLICTWTHPRTALAIMAILASVTYFLLLTLLFFLPKKP